MLRPPLTRCAGCSLHAHMNHADAPVQMDVCVCDAKSLSMGRADLLALGMPSAVQGCERVQCSSAQLWLT